MDIKIKKVWKKLFHKQITAHNQQPVQPATKRTTCEHGHSYDETEYKSCPYCLMGYPKVVDSFMLYEPTTLSCPKCKGKLSVFSFPNCFGDDTGYYCERCHNKFYYGGTRFEGESLWNIVDEDEKSK